MARKLRPNAEEPTRFCLGIDTRTCQVVRIFGLRNRSYSLGGHTYSNEHNNPLEAEIGIMHSYLSKLQCFPMHLFDTNWAEQVESEMAAKAAKIKPTTS